MHPEEHRHDQETAEAEQQREALEPPEIAGAGRRDDDCGSGEDAQFARQSEILQGKADADELGDDRQRVQEKEVDDAERAPEPAEAFEDEARVADPGHRTKAQHHLLIDVKHRHQERQRPQQRGAVVLPGLRVGTETAGVVVADHDDEAGPEDREQRHETRPPAAARRHVAHPYRAERAADVADMRLVERSDGDRGLRIFDSRHGISPLPAAIA